jgi:DNA-binding FadR family transcriptional regulator
MVATLQSERLSEVIVREIVERVRTGRLAPGQRLPSERQLADSFGVSRVSVREGFRVLELLEVIEVRHNAGAFVAPEGGRGSGRLLRHWLTTHRTEVIELLEVREALESSAAEAAARRLASIDAPKVAPDSGLEKLAVLDIDFHNRVADASGNNVLAALIRELNEALKESRYAMFAMPDRPAKSQREHQKIVTAIRRGDGPAAHEAMRMHIARVRAQVQQLGDEGEGQS